ncbi:hypothetical protein [Natrialba sp. PRR66]|uniref:hypothetical protein n=1 Tax=Natrialba sp. PRR66 TaxID=3098146 RepID=UPI002B1D1D37|nr:hypothetical protein [Natrialba sp. PRR66]
MDRNNDPEGADGSDDRTGNMLARTWVIAANFRTPADYGIPEAPLFPARRRVDGALMLVGPEDSTPVMTVGETVPVRR